MKEGGRNEHGGDQDQGQPARAEDEMLRHEVEQNAGAQTGDQGGPAGFGVGLVFGRHYHK